MRTSTGHFRWRARYSRRSVCGASASSALRGFVDGLLKEGERNGRQPTQRRPRDSVARGRESLRPESSSARSGRRDPGRCENRRRVGPELFQAGAQHLSALAECGGGHRFDGRRPGAARHRRAAPAARRPSHLRRRREGARRHIEQEFRARSATAPAPQAARRPSSRARRRCAPPPRAGTSASGSPSSGGHGSAESQPTRSGVRDVVGKVGDDAQRPAARERGKIEIRAHPPSTIVSRPGAAAAIS